jgi:hypothetical protein
MSGLDQSRRSGDAPEIRWQLAFHTNASRAQRILIKSREKRALRPAPQWLAYMLPCRRAPPASWPACQ